MQRTSSRKARSDKGNEEIGLFVEADGGLVFVLLYDERNPHVLQKKALIFVCMSGIPLVGKAADALDPRWPCQGQQALGLCTVMQRLPIMMPQWK